MAVLGLSVVSCLDTSRQPSLLRQYRLLVSEVVEYSSNVTARLAVAGRRLRGDLDQGQVGGTLMGTRPFRAVPPE
jgi:hypothetical protein